MNETTDWIFATTLAELRAAGMITVQRGGHTVVLVLHSETLFAVDNRCPHMGFPLDKGTVKDGLLTCHWRHARFDLASGGTFDQWAGEELFAEE
jgi:nitrite reductase/ring-hydroxylating ferredoxin subunit